jgi:CheY-like chemotaxis protein
MIEYKSKILVAEDDPDDTLLLQDAFSEIHQGGVSYFSNGKYLVDYMQELLRTKEAEIPQLILIDLNMPMMDGRGVLKALRCAAETKEIPVVVLSTTKDEGDINKVMELGANQFFSKPTRFDDLVQILTSLRSKWLTYEQG